MVEIINGFGLEADDFWKNMSLSPTDTGYELKIPQGDELLSLVKELQKETIAEKGFWCDLISSNKIDDENSILKIILPFYSDTFITELIPAITQNYIYATKQVPKEIRSILSDDKFKNYDERISSLELTLENLFETSIIPNVKELIHKISNNKYYYPTKLPLEDICVDPSDIIHNLDINKDYVTFSTKHNISFNLYDIPFYGVQPFNVRLQSSNPVDYSFGSDRDSSMNTVKTYIKLTPDCKKDTFYDMLNLLDFTDNYVFSDIIHKMDNGPSNKTGIENILIKGVTSIGDGQNNENLKFYDFPYNYKMNDASEVPEYLILEVTSFLEFIPSASNTIKDKIIGALEQRDHLDYEFIAAPAYDL